MTTILVTGSAGFIGFFVSKELLSQDYKVIGIDNFNDYYLPDLKRRRVEILKQNPNYIQFDADISDNSAITAIFENHRVDIVCHLAAQAGVRYSLINPHAYQESNLQGFVNLIEATRKAEIERFVYASSSSVYGGNTKMPYAEDDPVNNPVSLYAATKRANELMAYSYTHLWKIQTVGLRFFTVYGPWGRPDMAYWSFLEAILNEEPIKVFNYGKNRRDFTYIDDIVQGVMSALNSTELDQYEIINLGNHEPVELMDFIETLEKLAGRQAIKEMVPPQPGDVIATFASIEKAHRKLGFIPTTLLEQGLEKFVTWYKEHRELTDAVRSFRRRK